MLTSLNVLHYGITVFKICLWGGISSDFWSEMLFYSNVKVEQSNVISVCISNNQPPQMIFLIWLSGDPFVQRSGTICAILVEGIMNNSVKSCFFIRTSVSGDVILKISYQELWHPSCWRNRIIYAILVEGNMGNIHVKVFYIWTSGSRRDVI